MIVSHNTAKILPLDDFCLRHGALWLLLEEAETLLCKIFWNASWREVVSFNTAVLCKYWPVRGVELLGRFAEIDCTLWSCNPPHDAPDLSSFSLTSQQDCKGNSEALSWNPTVLHIPESVCLLLLHSFYIQCCCLRLSLWIQLGGFDL